MNVAIFGATGATGSRFCRRALDAGHQITPFSFRRTEIAGVSEIQSTPIDLTNSTAIRQALEGVDVVVSAIGGENSSRYTGIAALVQAAQAQQITRIIAVGGAGILDFPAGGILKEQPFFPAFLIPISDAHQAALEQLKQSTIDWTMICPGTMSDGHSNGNYRHQASQVLPDMKGVLYDDVAHLMLRCAQEELYLRQRVSISNP